mmetsp:Transcript_122943/g.348464  ORF Transcript_122943/g.348464 Transcript_122943/m.348464 type:complete len:313 (+) Transcript_122943:342-1280(+)
MRGAPPQGEGGPPRARAHGLRRGPRGRAHRAAAGPAAGLGRHGDPPGERREVLPLRLLRARRPRQQREGLRHLGVGLEEAGEGLVLQAPGRGQAPGPRPQEVRLRRCPGGCRGGRGLHPRPGCRAQHEASAHRAAVPRPGVAVREDDVHDEGPPGGAGALQQGRGDPGPQPHRHLPPGARVQARGAEDLPARHVHRGPRRVGEAQTGAVGGGDPVPVHVRALGRRVHRALRRRRLLRRGRAAVVEGPQRGNGAGRATVQAGDDLRRGPRPREARGSLHAGRSFRGGERRRLPDRERALPEGVLLRGHSGGDQ